MKRGKKYLETVKGIDKSLQYDPQEAIALAKKVSVAKFVQLSNFVLMQ